MNANIHRVFRSFDHNPETPEKVFKAPARSINSAGYQIQAHESDSPSALLRSVIPVADFIQWPDTDANHPQSAAIRQN